MASSLPSFSALVKPPLKCNTRRSLQVRAQGFRDEGRSSNIVDANLCVLRERINMMRIKERLERCCSAAYGWNYAPGYNYKLKKDRELSQFFELVSLAVGTVGLTIISGTMCLYLVSLLVHLNQ